MIALTKGVNGKASSCSTAQWAEAERELGEHWEDGGRKWKRGGAGAGVARWGGCHALGGQCHALGGGGAGATVVAQVAAAGVVVVEEEGLDGGGVTLGIWYGLLALLVQKYKYWRRQVLRRLRY